MDIPVCLQDKAAGGELHCHLRCRKQRRKRYGTYNRRGQLIDRTSIDDRPAVVDSRTRIGDWEADTIIGKGHKQAIVSLTERKSRFTLIKKVKQKSAKLVSEAIVSLLSPMPGKVHTLTSDNGKEFAEHKAIAARLNAKFFFAHPYASWERGLNENTNGLIRQYLPKRISMDYVTHTDCRRIADWINARPRKRLGFRSPAEVFNARRPVLRF